MAVAVAVLLPLGRVEMEVLEGWDMKLEIAEEAEVVQLDLMALEVMGALATMTEQLQEAEAEVMGAERMEAVL